MAKTGEAAAASPGSRGESGGEMTRRSFLSTLAVAWISFTAIVLGSVLGLVRFLFPNVLFEPPQSFRAGFVDEYTVGEVSTRWKDQFGVWIIREEEQVYALSTVCTHLGCTPNWLEADRKFKCPCHGSGFRITGHQLRGAGPAPAGAVQHLAGRRRPDRGRQDQEVPVGEGRVERPLVLPRGLTRHGVT